MLLILTFGAIVVASGSALAWGKNLLLVLYLLGMLHGQQPRSALLVLGFESCVGKCLCCNVVHKAAHSYRTSHSIVHSSGILSSVGQSHL